MQESTARYRYSTESWETTSGLQRQEPAPASAFGANYTPAAGRVSHAGLAVPSDVSVAGAGNRASGAQLGRRLALLASPDAAQRNAVAGALRAQRWEVLESEGGAGLFACGAQIRQAPSAILVDSWLGDLEVRECVAELLVLYPGVDIFSLDGGDLGAPAPSGSFRAEVLHALRGAGQALDRGSHHNSKQTPEYASNQTPDHTDGAAWAQAPTVRELVQGRAVQTGAARAIASPLLAASHPVRPAPAFEPGKPPVSASLPELTGSDPRMLEVSRRIRLVAPRSTAVLVQGPSGTGKELVARALHRLSPRAGKAFHALNCAAIPEALLEAELFGHTRGAFTGAVQGRTGRLEAAHGGTLFLDEIGELPLSLQAKLLRFAECGELQRMGENEPVRVDVRIIAATHRPLRKMAAEGTFRLDLYHRLSVFLIETPALAGRHDDIALLAERTLARMSERESPKWLAPEALDKLLGYTWPGNVRELQHTLERAWILAGDSSMIGAGEIDFGLDGEF